MFHGKTKSSWKGRTGRQRNGQCRLENHTYDWTPELAEYVLCFLNKALTCTIGKVVRVQKQLLVCQFPTTNKVILRKLISSMQKH